MTPSLFSQLVSEFKGGIGPTELQRRIVGLAHSSLTPEQNAGLVLYWQNLVTSVSATAAVIDPSTILAVMAGLPEVQDANDDFFFI